MLSQINYWWLVGVNLVVGSGFLLQKFYQVGGRPTNAICCSVNVDRVVVLLGGGRDTPTLHAVIKLIWTFCSQFCAFMLSCALQSDPAFVPSLFTFHVTDGRDTSTRHPFILTLYLHPFCPFAPFMSEVVVTPYPFTLFMSDMVGTPQPFTLSYFNISLQAFWWQCIVMNDNIIMIAHMIMQRDSYLRCAALSPCLKKIWTSVHLYLYTSRGVRILLSNSICHTCGTWVKQIYYPW